MFVFKRSLFCLPRLNLLGQKYSKKIKNKNVILWNIITI